MKRISDNIPLRATGTKSVTVTRDLTVAHANEHMPEVYATPMMIYLMEIAAGATVQRYLPEGWVSVGTLVNVKHLAPTPVGYTVTAKAEIVSVSDNFVTLAVEAHDGVEKIGEGTQVRAVVEVERFMRRVNLKTRKNNHRRLKPTTVA